MIADAIVYETPKQTHYVRSVGKRGFEVYRNGAVCAERVACIGNGPAPRLGIERAKLEADRRENDASLGRTITLTRSAHGQR